MIFRYLRKVFFAIVILTVCITGRLAFSENSQDPYERFNRDMFKFNDFLDTYFLKPVATVYNKIVPKPLAKGLSNVYSNIDNVPTIINDVLQGNFYQATSDTWRLAINTTIGIGGFFDPASHIGLEPNSEDFGLTLAQWGYTKSNYLVLPFIGPTTVRDGISYPINYYYMSIYPLIKPTRDEYYLYFGGVIVRRAELLSYENFMQQAAIDKYVFIRDAYLQHRNYMIERNSQLGNPYTDQCQLEDNCNGPPDAPPCATDGGAPQTPQ